MRTSLLLTNLVKISDVTSSQLFPMQITRDVQLDIRTMMPYFEKPPAAVRCVSQSGVLRGIFGRRLREVLMQYGPKNAMQTPRSLSAIRAARCTMSRTRRFYLASRMVLSLGRLDPERSFDGGDLIEINYKL